MIIYNKKTKEIIAIINKDTAIIKKDYDITKCENLTGNGKTIYIDCSEDKIINLKDWRKNNGENI